MANDQYNILVIDDEELILELIQHMLVSADAGNVTLRDSCQKALSLFKSKPDKFDMIISDWDVPALNGLEFLKRVRVIDPTIPFMMVTANSSKRLVTRAKEEGIDDYLIKPFSAKGLIDKVEQLKKKREPGAATREKLNALIQLQHVV
jgi:two-component system, chemotaxis family, chemotaxis protein CheY